MADPTPKASPAPPPPNVPAAPAVDQSAGAVLRDFLAATKGGRSGPDGEDGSQGRKPGPGDRGLGPAGSDRAERDQADVSLAAPDPAVELTKFCPECGAPLVWMAARQALGCSYCGTLLPSAPPADPDPTRPRPGLESDTGHGAGSSAPSTTRADPALRAHLEHDLIEALRNPPGGRDWGDERREVQCASCGAISIFVDGRVAQACDFCGSPKILAHEAHGDAITPQSLLPFKVADTVVRDTFRTWIGQRWFAPNALKAGATLDQLHGIYLPYWTFDARVSARWSAESGRTVARPVQRRNADGQWQTVTEQTVIWTPVSGAFEHFFDDELVPGTEGVHRNLLRRIEPFPTTTDNLRLYQADFVRGWTVERYQIDLRQAQAINRDDMENQVRALAARQVGNPLQRNLQVAAEYSGRTFKHVLMPVWLVSYRYHGKAYQLVANGWTGALAGERPYSWAKIAFAVVIALIVLAIGATLQR